jgi:hypothetical protein
MLLPWLFISSTGAKVFITGPFYAGMIFGPPSLANIRIYGVALLEFQAESFAILAAYVFATRLLVPKMFAISNYKDAIIVALRSYLELSLFVPIFFVVAAGYEAWSITSLIPQNPFPSTYDSQFALHTKHTNAIINFNNQQIYYDSTMLQTSDAKIAQIVLHDIGYFGPLSIYKDSLHYSVKISLSEENWGKQETIRRLTAAATRLKGSFVSRQYEIVACSRDSLANWREKSLANP